jgi:hypothetical protein
MGVGSLHVLQISKPSGRSEWMGSWMIIEEIGCSWAE